MENADELNNHTTCLVPIFGWEEDHILFAISSCFIISLLSKDILINLFFYGD